MWLMQVGSEAKQVMDFFRGLLVSAATRGGECWGGALAQLCLLPSICGSSRLVQGFLSGRFLCKPLKQALTGHAETFLSAPCPWRPDTKHTAQDKVCPAEMAGQCCPLWAAFGSVP